MDESERLHAELNEIKKETEKAREEKLAAITDPESVEAVLDLIAARELLDVNDPHLHKLQKKVQEKKRDLVQREKELGEKLKTASRNLHILTGPAIEKGVEQLNRELIGLKIEKRTIGRLRSGFSMDRRIIVETNIDGIIKIQRVVREGIESLRGMAEKPISEIEAFIEEKVGEIRRIDLKPIRKEVDEFEDTRNDFATSRSI